MEDKAKFIEPLLAQVEQFGTSGFDLLKLKALDKTADFLSTAASRSLTLLSIYMFILIANIGFAIWIGELLGKAWYGFFCVAGFYGLMGFVLFYFAHKGIKRCVSNSIVTQVLN